VEKKKVLAEHIVEEARSTAFKESLRSIAAELAAMGHVNIHGRPFAAESINVMVQRLRPRRHQITY
jgi:hypothetical protein